MCVMCASGKSSDQIVQTCRLVWATAAWSWHYLACYDVTLLDVLVTYLTMLSICHCYSTISDSVVINKHVLLHQSRFAMTQDVNVCINGQIVVILLSCGTQRCALYICDCETWLSLQTHVDLIDPRHAKVCIIHFATARRDLICRPVWVCSATRFSFFLFFLCVIKVYNVNRQIDLHKTCGIRGIIKRYITYIEEADVLAKGSGSFWTAFLAKISASLTNDLWQPAFPYNSCVCSLYSFWSCIWNISELDIHTNIPPHTHARARTHTYIYIHTRIHTYIHTYIHTCTTTCIHTVLIS